MWAGSPSRRAGRNPASRPGCAVCADVSYGFLLMSLISRRSYRFAFVYLRAIEIVRYLRVKPKTRWRF